MAEFSLLQPVHHDIYPFIDPSVNLKDAAKGRTVLVTGGGSGLGVAIAKRFAIAHASNIVLTGRRYPNLKQVADDISVASPNTKVHPITSDVSDEKSVDKLFETIKSIGLKIDIVINNAGIESSGAIANTEVDKWWDHFEIMVKGPYLITRAYLLAKDHSGPGAIISTSSLSSNALLPQQSAYSLCKTALNRLTEWIADEGATQNVRAFAFHPGGVPGTGITSKCAAWLQPYFTETADLGAGTCVYLSTERAAFLNGRYVDATWDMEELEGMKDRIVKEDLLKTGVIGNARLVL